MMPQIKRLFAMVMGEYTEITDPSKLTAKQRKWCKENGVKLRTDKRTRQKATYPMTSTIAAGVHPDQRFEAMEAAKAAGVPTFYNEDGDPVWESPGHRKRHCEAFGLGDNNGGYSDPQYKNR
tara:strand:- start:518 stop:883 length:366 start_codon:yes stop_codon:yes gene_type:complete